MVPLYLAILILVVWIVVQAREREGFLGIFPDALKVGNPLRGEELVTTDPASNQAEIYQASPHNTCLHPKTELQDGLCYEPCRKGYKGVGPVCWAETTNVGVGTLAPCPDGWNDGGLICTRPLNCRTWCAGGRDIFGNCWAWDLRTECGGGTWGKMNGDMPCPSDREGKDGLCYKKCPADKPHRVPGMPYLCYAGGDLSYGRGVGDVPGIVRFFNKYKV